MRAIDKAIETIKELNVQILTAHQAYRDKENECEHYKRLLDVYKSQSELVIDLAEDMIVDRELRLVK